MLNRVQVDMKTFTELLDAFPSFVDKEDISMYLAAGYKNKNRIKYDPRTNTLICQAYRLNYVAGRTVTADDWMQIICVPNNNLDSSEEIKPIMWATKANKIIRNILTKYYTEAQIEECLNNHSIDDREKPMHELLPSAYCDGKIHEFHDCVYYDINGAHRDALREIFPLAAKEFETVLKDAANFYVGDLCNHGHRGTFDWIVQRTRNMILNIIDEANGLILYVNTDGAIIWHPEKELNTSNALGMFKSEMSDNIVYAVNCRGDGITPYTVYQYSNRRGKKTIKGNCRNDFRKNMDLSKGLIVNYKSYKEDGLWKYKDIKLIQKEIINEN